MDGLFQHGYFTEFISGLFLRKRNFTVATQVVRRLCEGCQIESLSQTDHSCVLLSQQQQLILYFENILSEIDECDILINWREAASQIVTPEYIAMYELKLNCPDWRQTMKTPSWKKRIMQLTSQLRSLDKYF